MNSLEILAEELKLEIPDATIVIDKPEVESGAWYLDVKKGERIVTIAWESDKPFGISIPAQIGYGEGCHELCMERLKVAMRVVDLLS